jgi:hypothetical protein
MDLARPRWSTTTHRNPVVGACVLSAVLHAAVAVVAPENVVAMPTAPPPVPVVAALGAALLVAAADRTGVPARARTGLAALCAVGMLAGSLLAVPHTLLLALIWAVGRVTGGTGPFDVAPDWLTTAAHLATVAAVGLLVAWAVRDRRVHRGLCPACGRADHGPTGAHRSALPRLAALTVAGSLPYGLLKLAWALGWTGGLTGHAFDGVSFTSPGFGDTAVLTGVSVVAAASMGARATGRWTRRVLIAVGTIGSLMLLPVAAVGVVQLVPVVLGLTTIDDSEIAVWAFLVVYGSFLAWGTALAALTVAYRQETRGTCREAGPAGDRP